MELVSSGTNAERDWIPEHFQEIKMDKLDGANRKNRQLVRTLISLVRVLEDGQQGMAELGERLQDPALRRQYP